MVAYIAYVAILALYVKQKNATFSIDLCYSLYVRFWRNPLSLRRQTNVSLSLPVAEKMDRFARIFHRSEFAPVARVLIEEALRHVTTEAEYLEALKRSAVDEGGRPSAQLEATHGKVTRRK